MHKYRFLPCAETARRNDQMMHDKLVSSLRYLADCMAPIDPTLPRKFEAWITQLPKRTRLAPVVFGAYYDIVSALEADRTQIAQKEFERVLLAQHVAENIQICHLTRDHTRLESRRIRRFMGSPETGASGIRQPKTAQAREFAKQLDEALNWIEKKLPDLFGEIRALIREIILVGPAGNKHSAFEGGTCFRLWGALVLNAERDVTVPELVTTVAHESGHAALFGFCQDEMLVENPDTELHWSPIRQDDRPLEGIFHAAFVSARMVWALRHMLASKDFGAQARRSMEMDVAEATKVYQESVSIVQTAGKLTKTGSAILASTEAYMSARSEVITAA